VQSSLKHNKAPCSFERASKKETRRKLEPAVYGELYESHDGLTDSDCAVAGSNLQGLFCNRDPNLFNTRLTIFAGFFQNWMRTHSKYKGLNDMASIYVKISDKPVTHSREVTNGYCTVVVDWNEHEPVGIEILEPLSVTVDGEEVLPRIESSSNP
jgi:hypothetical protein